MVVRTAPPLRRIHPGMVGNGEGRLKTGLFRGAGSPGAGFLPFWPLWGLPRTIPRGQRTIPRGQRMIPRSQRMIPRGQRMIPRGQRTIPRGQRMIPRGQRTIPRGQRMIPRGQRMIPRGQRMIPRGQWSSLRNVAAAAGIPSSEFQVQPRAAASPCPNTHPDSQSACGGLNLDRAQSEHNQSGALIRGSLWAAENGKLGRQVKPKARLGGFRSRSRKNRQDDPGTFGQFRACMKPIGPALSPPSSHHCFRALR